MAFMLGDDIDQEIRTALQSDIAHTLNQDDEIIHLKNIKSY